MSRKKDIFQIYNPGTQPVTSDSSSEPKLSARGKDAIRVPPKALSSIFIDGIIGLAIKSIDFAFSVYLSRHASMRPGGSITFEDNDTRLPIDVETPKNKY